jgi:hypothetical protein
VNKFLVSAVAFLSTSVCFCEYVAIVANNAKRKHEILCMIKKKLKLKLTTSQDAFIGFRFWSNNNGWFFRLQAAKGQKSTRFISGNILRQ